MLRSMFTRQRPGFPTVPAPGRDPALQNPPAPQYLYVESRAGKEALTLKILDSVPWIRVYEITDHRRLDAEAVPFRGYDPGIKSQVLVLAHNPGPFVRPFRPLLDPGKNPDFFISHANGCPFDCHYCFLQGYFPHGAPVVFVNQDVIFEELERHLEAQTKLGPATYHAGELSDALALEPWSGFARRAIGIFRKNPLARLELRTKCAGIEDLLPDDPPPNVVCSWTLTPRDAWQRFEQDTPDPVQRLRTARACQEKGYSVGIRLDPALLYPGWEEGYRELIAAIFECLLPRSIESIVLGGFRFLPGLAVRIRERFPECSLLLAEFVPCPDGKHRYFRPLRVELYRKIIREIRKHDGGIPVQICMESEQVIQDVGEGLIKGTAPSSF